ncbi:MAG: hypothetical protein GY877_10810 [Hyphomicrobium sp.]|nr:hypothetical protein [Hyphomicrobium sp.]
MVGTAATPSKAFASAGVAGACQCTTGLIAQVVKAGTFLIQCEPLILETLIVRVP